MRVCLAVLLLLAAGCQISSRPAPALSEVSPDHGAEGAPLQLTIHGEHFAPKVSTDFAQPGESGLDALFSARLGTTALREVKFVDGNTLTATVPEGLSPGSYDLAITDPAGIEATLPDAFRVDALTAAGVEVARFQFEPIPAQLALVPFVVAISAFDAQGAVVSSFNGTATLSDATGTAAPKQVGAFVSGIFRGSVEIRAAHPDDRLTVTDAAGHTGQSAPFAVSAAAAIGLAFLDGPQQVVAGSCSPAVRLGLVDAFGAAAVTPVSLPVAVKPADPSLAVFSDASCTSPLSLEIAAGQGTATVHFKGVRARATRLAVSAVGLRPASQLETVLAGSPSVLAFVTPPRVSNAGSCSPLLTLEARDGFANPSAPAAPLEVALAANPSTGFQFFSDSACLLPITSATLAAGSSSAGFYFSGTLATTVTVTAAATGLATTQQDERINPQGSATQLVFVSAPLGAPAGSCSQQISVQTQDSLGNPVDGAGAVQIALSASPGAGFKLFSDALCTSPVTTTQIAAGTSLGGFWCQGTLAGPVEVTAVAGGLNAAKQIETIVAAPPGKVVFLSAPQTFTAASCSAEARLQLQDAFGNPAPPSSPATIALSAAPATGFRLFSDAACTKPVVSVATAAGATVASFWFSGRVAGAVTVTADAGTIGSVTQVETLTAGSPTALAFLTAPQAVAAGSCSGVTTIEVRDAGGNPAAVTSATPLSLASAALAFFSDPGCVIPVSALSVGAMSSSASLYFKGTAAGPATLDVSSAGLTPASQSETIGAGAPSRLAFTSAPQTVTAGSCSGAVTVVLRDALGNTAAAPAPRSVALSGAPAQFFSDAACATPISAAPIASGGSSATFHFRATTAGAFTLTADSAPLASATQGETVVAGALDHLAFQTPARSALVGACSAAVVLEARDAFDNVVVLPSALPVALAAPGVGLFSDLACATAVTGVTLSAGSSSATFRFSGTTPGTFTMTSSASVPAGSQAATVVPSGSATRLAFTTTPQTVVAGACSAPVVVERQDSFGNPVVPASTAVVTLGAPGLTLYSDLCVTPVTSATIAPGASQATFRFRGPVSGAATLTASSGALTPASQGETITPDLASKLVYVTAPRTATAGACSAIVTVGARDQFGNKVSLASALPLTLAPAPAAGFTVFSDTACGAAGPVSIAAGQSDVSFSFMGLQAGTVVLSAGASGLTGATQGETVVAGPADHLVFVTGAQSVIAGACSAIATVQAKDVNGNDAVLSAGGTVALSASPAPTLTFHDAAGCGSAAVTSVAIPAGSGAAGFFFKATTARTYAVTAAVTGLTSISQSETVGPAAADHLFFVTAPQSVAAGACSGLATLESRDVFGNVSPVTVATAVTLDATPAASFAFKDPAGCGGASVSTISVAAGASQASFRFTATVATTYSAAASRAGWVGAAQSESITPLAASSFVWDPIGSPQSQATPFGVTVRARDALGNPTPAYTGTATLSSTPAFVVACTSSCGATSLLTSAFTAGVWSGAVSLAAPASGSIQLVATDASLTGTSAAFTVSGPPARSPPTARFTRTPPGWVTPITVNFNAGASSDYQTAAAALLVSWDFSGTAATAPGGAGWTAFSATKTASFNYSCATAPSCTIRPRLAVKDTDGDIGYATLQVVVLTSFTTGCLVDTAADTDDLGATTPVDCLGSHGTDNRLSLREALRISNAAAGKQWIGFNGAMTITGTGSYAITNNVDLVAPPGVVLDTKTLALSGAGKVVSLSGLELTRQPTPVTVGVGATLRLEDTYLHDMAGIVVKGRADLLSTRMTRCTADCLVLDDPAALGLTVAESELTDSSFSGIRLLACPAASAALDVSSTVFARLARGVDGVCTGSTAIRNNTFEANGVGVSVAGGAGHVWRNNLFTAQTGSAASCGAATFTTRDAHQLFGNASNGCVGADPSSLSASPLYLQPGSNDYRLQLGSPSRDTGVNVGIDVNGAGPGSFTGVTYDRGGRETW